jgi:beta-galactosidase
VIHVVRNAAPGRAAALERRRGSGPGPADHDRRRHAPAKIDIADDWTPADLSPHPETIEVYSNCPSVEVTLNGKALGAKPLPADGSPRQWSVTFAPGEVVASCGGSGPRDVLRTAGKPPRAWCCRPTTRPWARPSTTWPSSAPRWWTPRAWSCRRRTRRSPSRSAARAGFVAADNAAPTDHTPFASPTRQAWRGKATAFVRGSGSTGATAAR